MHAWHGFLAFIASYISCYGVVHACAHNLIVHGTIGQNISLNDTNHASILV